MKNLEIIKNNAKFRASYCFTIESKIKNIQK